MRKNIKKILKRLVNNPKVYSGEVSLDTLDRKYISATKDGVIGMYVTPDGSIECIFKDVNPWKLFDELYEIMFTATLVGSNTFKGGKFDAITKRVLSNLL